MGMKKLLLGLVGIVCALFAVPSFANCNLFETVDTTSGLYGVTLTSAANGLVTVVGTATTNGGRNSVQLQNFTLPAGTYTVSFSGTKRSQLYLVAGNDSSAPNLVTDVNGGTFTISESTTLHFGLNLDSGTTYNDSFYIQVEEGTTATPYTPYNPLCETCDGTVVNYTSATGTVTQNGTPTPTNPITPTFYTQGDMVLRKVGDYADTYDATTGKITRRVGVKVLDGVTAGAKIGTAWNTTYKRGSFAVSDMKSTAADVSDALSSHFEYSQDVYGAPTVFGFGTNNGTIFISFLGLDNVASADTANAWLAEQYAAGTPVTIYYPLAEPVEEDWPSSYCQQAIKVASTKYVETEFSALNTALANAVATVNTVVTQTIAQAASIATLQSGKQTRPADNTECPAYKQCLLVEDEQGVPHWYEITDPFRDFVAPIIANNVAPASTTNSSGYTQLEYIESTGEQWIDTGVVGNMGIAAEIKLSVSNAKTSWILGSRTGTDKRFGAIILSDTWDFGLNTDNSFGQYVVERDYVINFVTNLNTPSTMSINNGNSIAVSEVNNTDLQLYLFNVNYNGTPTSGQGFIGKIYYSKIWNNGTLVRNFVPVRNNATGKYGMYDTVGQRFYGNAASSGDDFTPGTEVLNQDPDVPGMTWTATWAANATTGVSAGTVYGEGLCNAVAVDFGAVATSTQTSSANWSVDGANCWCRATAIDDGDDTTIVDGLWVFYGTRSSAADCASTCAYVCAGNVRSNASFRSAVFGM